MTVEKIGFPPILLENDKAYFAHLLAIIESVDINSSVQITKKLHNINVRITPSKAILIEPMMKRLEDVHNKFGIKLEYSKSIKSSYVINFVI